MTFIEQALVFFGAAVILVPIFQRLRFGSVLGYLIAGILVGPQGLRLIPHAESVLHFSELGVAMLLFMIGLEIQPRKLWAMRQHLFGLGGLQVLITSVMFTGILALFGHPPLVALVIGFGLSLSSTAFALQTLSERNQLNTEFGRASFSVLLMQDLAAIPALALIPLLLSSQKEASISPVAALQAAVIVILVITTGRLVIRPVFRLIASSRSREIFTAAALFIVLGVAALMQKVGLSAALGTFIAGVLLADSEYRHEIEADLEPFKSLLMGLFFIAVGMGVSLEVITQQPVVIFALSLGYLFVKAAVIYGVGRFFRFNHETAKMMAVTIAQGGEFAFVIFGIATQVGGTPPETMAMFTAVITLSMALSPALNWLNSQFTLFRSHGDEPRYDEIKDESPEVIIAGFGRFGQIFGRLLRAQNIPFVAIEHDSEQIDLLRRFGSKVYYGDASRVDILEAAGAAKAKFFVLAIDDVEQSLQTVHNLKQHFPHLRIFARARNRGHVFDLMELGVTDIKREILDSSLYFVGDFLIALGFAPARAKEIVEKFKQHDEIMLQEQFKVRDDDKNMVSVSKQAAAQLAEVLREDSTKSYVQPMEKEM